ncbi:hypothetical protein [Thermobifida halotolerans]|uniref:hypothetical protein n=1 Tax=Thermobifida halotolerans TaxID=483545 RepID=UPI00227720AE|nr:hypothetical protein [Thermobifida halotolerans]
MFPWSAPGASPGGAPAPPPGPAAPGRTPPSGPGEAAPGGSERPEPAALRPYALGDLLNGGFGYLRDNPRTVFGLAFVVVAFTSVLPALGLTDLFTGYAELIRSETLPSTAPGLSGLGTAGFYAGALVQSVGSGVLLGLLSGVVGMTVLGRRPSLREAFAHVRGSWGSLAALAGFYLLLSGAALVVLGVVLALSLGLTLLLPLAGLPVLFLGLAGCVALFGWLAVKTSLAIPAAILERAGPGQALVRSWRLSTGNFWRIAAVLVLSHLLAYVLTNVLTVPFSLGALIVSASLTDLSVIAVVSGVLSFLGILLSGCVSEPFTAGVTALLYLDVRMRREALDLRLREAVRSGATPGPEAYLLARPLGAMA